MSAHATAPAGAQRPGFRPYLYGAAQGRPSKGRPERVLAHLKSTGAIKTEDGVADGHDGSASARGSLPGSPRNGFPAGGLYVYGGSGRSLHEDEAAALVTRGLEPAKTPRPRPKAAERKRCPDCGQPAPDHLIVCARAPEGAPPLDAGPGEPEPAASTRCHRCGYLAGSDSCLVAHEGAKKMPTRCRRCGYVAGSGNCLASHGGAR